MGRLAGLGAPCMFNWNDLVFFLELSRQGRFMPIAPKVSVERDLFISVHDDIQFMGGVRAVTRFLFSLFERDSPYLND